jgi:hypothetical protein
MLRKIVSCLCLASLSALATAETFPEIAARLGRDTAEATAASPYSALSRNFFSRFSRNADATIENGEIEITSNWRIAVEDGSSPLAHLMATYLQQFLKEGMGVEVPIRSDGPQSVIILSEHGGGTAEVAESFTLDTQPQILRVQGADSNGLRDGVVKLVELMGLRQGPYVKNTAQVYTPRLPVRLGAVPNQGGPRDLLFMGYNAVFHGGGSIYAFSTSDALPELAGRRSPGMLEGQVAGGAEVRRHGFKTFAFVDARQKFAEDHPVFAAHPEVKGARTWSADGEFVLCTEHPLVQRFHEETIRGLFTADPALDGVTLIIGGEGFYHCFMRPNGVEKGHTTCPRCEALGAEQVVANLVNRLAAAARSVKPTAEVVIWPYSAEHVWTHDKTQEKLISLLKPGVALLTEIEKDEYLDKPAGFKKHLWDYSIDLIGPGERAKKQIAACQKAGISVYLKSEPELGFEAPRLPHIPCMDRWWDRGEALASCGATGAWVFPAFRPNYGTSATEVNKLTWWSPVGDKEEQLQQLAARIAGPEAGPHLRNAWRHVSEAIPWSPEIPSYYNGPAYLGAAHPMVADPEAKLPEVFYGYYLFLAEMTDAEGTKTRPTFVTSPTGSNVPAFGEYYRKMEGLLAQAMGEMAAADPLVPERSRLMFNAEASPMRWWYHTLRASANFYESCQIRDRVLALAAQPTRTTEEQAEAARLLARWREVLENERENAQAALPIVEADFRLDHYYGGDHTFPHSADMIRAKLEILEREIGGYLPELATKCGVTPTA